MPHWCSGSIIARLITLEIITILCVLFSVCISAMPSVVAQIHQIQLQGLTIKIITGPSYYPQVAPINTGTLVTWVNQDTGNNNLHTVTFVGADIYDSGIIPPNVTVSHVFSNQGVFKYFCKIHPFMTGVLTVS